MNEEFYFYFLELFIDLFTSIALSPWRALARHHIYKYIPYGSTAVLLCKIDRLIVTTVPEHSFKGDERITSRNEVWLGLFILKDMWKHRLHQQPECYGKYAALLLDNRVATLGTRIKVYPSLTQETLCTQREIYMPTI